VETYEIGIKGAVFDRRLRFEIAAFDSTYDDRQEETVLQPPGTNVVFNIESASIRGIEAQASLDITDNFNITGNLTFLDHQDDTTGEPLSQLADSTAFLAASYELPLADGSSFRLSGDMRIRSSRLNNDDVPLTIPSETLFGANLGWQSAEDTFSVTAWVRNLTNELDVQGLSTRTVLSANGGTLTPGAPRTFGVTAGYRF
jgi:iron complex outermembrane recepter protein